MPSMRRAGAWALALEQKDRCSMTVPYIFLSDDHFQRPGERVQVEGKQDGTNCSPLAFRWSLK